MTRRVVRPDVVGAETDDLPDCIELVDWRLGLDGQAEHCAGLDGPLVEEEIVAVEVHVDAERPLCGGDAGHVIDVGVREQNVPDVQRLALDVRQEFRYFIARVDENGLASFRTGHHEAVLEERTDGSRLDYDHQVILAILDDLMFTSKIKTTAAGLGVPVAFARSFDGALNAMRSDTPALVILDLNNPRTNPIGIVEAMKADSVLSGVTTVGFVSHVQTDVIEAARSAGVTSVLARSAFTQQLPEILKSGS